jgi:hypothetical protein
MTEGREESQQWDQIQIQGTITEGNPVALRTRRCRQQKAPNRINGDEGESFCVTTQDRDMDNELVRQLKTKIKEQESSINELSSAVEHFLKIQPIVKKLQGNILTISKQAVAIKVTASNIDLEIVKPFTPSLEKFMGMMKCHTDNVKSGTLNKNAQCHDTMKHPKTSEKKSCKRLACTATLVR